MLGRLKNKLIKTEVTLNDEENIEIYEQLGMVQKLGVNWTIKDFKELDASLNGIKLIR